MDAHIDDKLETRMAGTHIWLRHATQLTVGGRTHSIEASIPIPLGASAETSEGLIREAEARIAQLVSLVERRGTTQSVTVQAQRNQPVNTAPAPVPAPVPAAPRSPVAKPPTPAIPIPVPAPAPVQKEAPAPLSAAQARPKPVQAREADAVGSSEGEDEIVKMPPTRPTIGASMPDSRILAGRSGETMKWPQFMEFLQGMNLTPKQAMSLLHLTKLSDTNLRNIAEDLQQLAGKGQIPPPSSPAPVANRKPAPPAQTSPSIQKQQMSSPAPAPTQRARETGAPPPPQSSATKSQTVPPPAPPPTPARPATAPPPPPAPIPVRVPAVSATPPASAPTRSGSVQPSAFTEKSSDVVRAPLPVYTFDEEVDLEDEEDMEYPSGLNEEEREIAVEIVNKMRDAKGSAAASDGRIHALRNVTDGQLSETKLLEVIQGLWGVTSLKKLKDEQIEELIYWAKKADDFESEVDIVLTFIQEEQYASSDR